jgi:hypothetical protein
MSVIKLNQKTKLVAITDLQITNDIVFNFLDNLPKDEREEKLIRAIYIGVLALIEDRLSAFFAKTESELGTKMESLKMIFEMKKELFYKTALKGFGAEEDLVSFLNEYFEQKGLKDRAYLTGTMQGKLPKNKTGDIICEVNGNSEQKIVLEIKFDKSMKLGEIDSKEVFTQKRDTAWSQLLEAKANRESKISLIVFDKTIVDNSITKIIDNVGYIDGIGFIVIVNSQGNDFSNLSIGYMLARDILLNAKDFDLDTKQLTIIVNRLIKIVTDTLQIKSLVEQNINTNLEILHQLNKNLKLIEFTRDYLIKFLKDGRLSEKDMLDFYFADEVKDKYKEIEKEINNLLNPIQNN